MALAEAGAFCLKETSGSGGAVRGLTVVFCIFTSGLPVLLRKNRENIVNNIDRQRTMC